MIPKRKLSQLHERLSIQLALKAVVVQSQHLHRGAEFADAVDERPAEAARRQVHFHELARGELTNVWRKEKPGLVVVELQLQTARQPPPEKLRVDRASDFVARNEQAPEMRQCRRQRRG